MNNRLPTTWWIHGSAPGGEDFFDAAMSFRERYRMITVAVTCNAGLVEFLCHDDRRLVPDYYWLQDGEAVRLFGRYAQTASDLGTMVLTGKPGPFGDFVLNIQQVDLVNPAADPPCFLRGMHQHVTLSGLLCLQWVANQAEAGDTVVLTGMTGYASKPEHVVRDTFDGRMGKPTGHRHTTRRIAPFTRSVCKALPDVGFIFCGKPHRVFGPRGSEPANVTVCPMPADLTARLNHDQTPFEDKGMCHGQKQQEHPEEHPENDRGQQGLREREDDRDRDHASPDGTAPAIARPDAADHTCADQAAGPEKQDRLPGYQHQALTPHDVTTRTA